MSKKASKEEESLTRIAIVNSDKCKPRKCRQVRNKHIHYECMSVDIELTGYRFAMATRDWMDRSIHGRRAAR